MNPENTSDTSQSLANQDPLGQNMPNQNATFPSQDLRPVQNPPLQTPPLKSKRPTLIACIVGAVVLLIAIVCVVCTVVMQNNGNNEPIDDVAGNISNGPEEDAAENIALDATDVVDVEKFKRMTKTEAIAFLQAGRNTTGSTPKNYVGEEITDLIIVENNVVLSDVALKYSYDTINDLRQMAEEWYEVLGHNGDIAEDDYEIKEYDYYAIVTPNRIEGTNICEREYYGNCNSLFSFKRDYVNYFQEQTAPNSYNDVAYLNVRDPEMIERLLRIFSFFYNYGAASNHGNIYGSGFEEQDDKFVLTVYYIGVGLNMEKLEFNGSDVNYAINLYSRQYAADKVDGRLHVIQTGEDSTIENIKSIPITQGEAAQILSR